MATQRHIFDVRGLAARALRGGGKRKSLSTVTWDLSRGCSSPHYTEVWGRPESPGKDAWGHRTIVVGIGKEVPLMVELLTPCRKCDHCRKTRTQLWAARARSEIAQAPRTWMGTLTLRPEAWVYAVNQCRLREDKQGVDFDGLPEAERLALIHARLSREITLMLKRWRATGALFRYLVVLEMHQSGVIHYHILIHETDAEKPMRHRQLATGWPLGFSKWKLADATHAYYVAKYLTKTVLARVRASERYGGEYPSKTIDYSTHENVVKKY